MKKSKYFDLGQAIADLLPKKRTLEDIGQELGLSAESVRYHQNIALAKLFYRVRAKFTREESLRTPGIMLEGNWKAPLCHD
jgi:Sigma-70, region 4